MTTESTNFQISNSDAAKSKLSDRERKLRDTTDLNPIYMSQIVNYIEVRIEDPVLRNMVLERAKKFPHSALKNFFARFQTIVTDCDRIINERKAKEAGVVETIKRENNPSFKANDLMDLQSQLEKEHRQE